MTTNTGTAVAQRDPVKDLQADLSKETVKAQFAVALPAHIPPDQFVRVVMTAVAKNPDLAQADRRSLFNSCLEAAADGLLPNGKEAALVIFNTKEKQVGRDVWVKKVQYMPMVRGIRKLAFNSGQIKLLDAFCVHANDDFDYAYGFEPTVTHKPPKFGSDRGPIIGVYAVAETKDGERSLEVMDKAAVEKVRAVSRSKDSGPWVQWWDEMARKTVLRRLAKRLPLSAELERAIERDNALFEMEARRLGVAGTTIQGTAAGQLNAFAAAPALEHDAGSAPETFVSPPQSYALVTLDGEVSETTSAGDWLDQFESALQGAADPAKLWELNSDAAEWAADMTEGGDDALARLRKAYLTKPEQAQPTDWSATLAELKAGAANCADVAAWVEFKKAHADTLKAMPDDVFADWNDFAEARSASLKEAVE
ncbi:recombination protein RecT [Azospirillum baldaniorum]|uniref:recombinase RecT n=1 Tax=Azospirillum baldaniorum TaxID=1064539 RepID=UPI0011A23F1A|nr:recombinase RecT [Azospirillum baldaniorum]TWA71861.1 recombination protein RecT [Azospirillum baldaniorum]